MKKTLKILSVLCAVVFIFGTVSVGISAYAAAGNDVIGSYDYTITNPYKDIDWDNVTAYKSATHVHTVRSDADEEINRMIRNYYNLGYDAMALTDHGTINYGWTNDQARLAIFEYQYFVHGQTDELSEEEYKSIITGTKARNINSGKGMMEIPLGIELNGMSTIKCHINGYYADADHGGIGMSEDWPLNAVVKNYNAGGFTHINHVGEWSEGNDDASVYSKSWLTRFASIYQSYCPNRGGRGASAQTAWMSSHNGEAGCIGMELVNTADSRTHNDRRFVYDEILKILAPQGINVFGFCEDDSHEPSDCDRNAQYFLINNSKDVAISEAEYNASNKAEDDEESAYKNDNNDPIDKVQNYYRDAMFYGEFYASSKNSKNAYELGNGFVSNGPYPSISNISVDNDKDQISVTFKDATKIRMVADGEVVETYKKDAGVNTVMFDLNRNEEKINNYVRIYLTGAGGITYLQPFILTKTKSHQSTVQFTGPNNTKLISDVAVVVKDSNGSVVTEGKYDNFYYILPAGNYTYTASRRGYQDSTGKFSLAAAEIAEGVQKKIPVELEELSNIDYGYFYAPETIYLSPNDNQTFDKYVDRDNAINGAIHAGVCSEGNIFFTRNGAYDIELEYSVQEGAALVSSMTIGATTASGNTLSTSVTGGSVERELSKDEYILVKWTAKYKYEGRDYEAYTYSYIFSPPSDETSVVGAGGFAKTKKNIIEWAHTTMSVTASMYVFGLYKHNITLADANATYKFGPYTGRPLESGTSITATGKGFLYKSEDSSSGSVHITLNNTDDAYVYADRSRVDNWSQIPYFGIGFDLNEAEQVTGENGGNACARLAFDETTDSVTDGTYDPDHILYNLQFSSKSSYTTTIDYNLDDSTKTTGSGTKSNSLASFGYERFYKSDNNVAGKVLSHPLPSATAPESTIPISAYIYGTKESRADSLALGVHITVVNNDKSALRDEFNNAVKNGYQPGWFKNAAAFDTYQNAIVHAAKILGNPVVDNDTVETAEQDLEVAFDDFEFNTGLATVKYYWKLQDGTTGMFLSEDSYPYKYNEDLTANAKEITGYEYANEFDVYSEDILIHSGTDTFSNVHAEGSTYEWRFYYTPNEYTATYNTNGAGVTVPSQKVLFGQECTAAPAVQRSGYTFNGWYLDGAKKTYAASEKFKWNVADDAELVAQWGSNEYNITYRLDDGSEFNVADEYKTVAYGSTYSISPDVPLKTGSNFAGWILNGGDDVHTPGSQISWNIASDSELVASWEVSDYFVSFDLGDIGSEQITTPGNIKVTYGELYGTLPTVAREGYTVEWYSDPHCTSAYFVNASSKVVIAADHTLYAKWIPIKYNIQYNLNGGIFADPNYPKEYYVSSAAVALCAPVRSGYTFTGWSGQSFSGLKTNYSIPSGSTGDLTFTANWDVNGYEITYNLNGGENYPDNPVAYNSEQAVTIQPATKFGYKFLGWTGSNGSIYASTVEIPRGSSGDKNYIAHWDIENYTITYDYNEATKVPLTNPNTYNVLSDTFTLAVPERENYTFGGWQSDNNELVKDDGSVTIEKGKVTGNLSFRAIWIENDALTVTYRLNGGRMSSSNPTQYKPGQSFIINNPSRDGYKFLGWTKTIGGVNIQQETGTIDATDNKNITFSAKWSANTNDIIYELNGGQIVSNLSNPSTYTAADDDFTLVNPVRAGYTFAGWTGTGLTQAAKTVVIPTGSYGSRSYAAAWTADTYTINYDLNGGTNTGLPASYTVTTDTVVGAPVRPGYTFSGWSIDFNGFTWTAGAVNGSGKFVQASNSYYSNPVSLQKDSEYTIVSSVTGLKLYVFRSDLSAFIGSYTGSYTASSDCIAFIVAENQSTAGYKDAKLAISGTPLSYNVKTNSMGNMEFAANWSRENYTISYVLNDGTFGVDGDGNPKDNPNPTTYNYDSGDIQLTNPEKTGYTFSGWEYNGVVSTSAVIKAHSTGNRTYTAEWKIADYTITYRGLEGASVTGNRTTYTVNDAFTLNNPEKSGYTFDGWVGTGISVASKSVSVALGSIGNRQYTATWTPIVYSIEYENLRGASVSNPDVYTVETESFTLKNPVSPGTNFTGWSEEGSESLSTNVTIAKGSTGDKKYIANWNIPSYSISYNLAGGTVSGNPSTYTVDDSDIRLNRPTRVGYDFIGWSGTGIDNGTMEIDVIIPSGSYGIRSYTANWKPIDYTISYDLTGGQVADDANPTVYNIETPNIELVPPVKSGYVFAGWTGTDISTPKVEVTIPKGSVDNRRYTATWREDYYTIEYREDAGATYEYDKITSYTIVTNDFRIPNPSKPGYTFLGWTGTGISGIGTSSDVIVTKGSMGNRVYYAHWELTSYKLTYDLVGGEMEGTLTNPDSYDYFADAITLHNPVKTGYSFVGWESDYFDGTMETVTIPTNSMGDKAFKAVWYTGVYTIDLDANGGTLPSGQAEHIEFTYTTDDFTIGSPTRTGWSFTGWTGTGISSSSPVPEITIKKGSTGNRTYTATWVQGSNAIAYNLDGGTYGVYDDGTPKNPNPSSYTTNSGTITLVNPTKDGYKFDGWLYECGNPNIRIEENSFNKSVTIDTSAGGTIRFMAKWVLMPAYRITYNLNGGTASGNPTTYTVEDAFTLNNPTRTGYTFEGWSGTGLNGTHNTSVSVSKNTGNRVYTANWIAETFTITYDYNGGSIDGDNPINYSVLTPTFTLINPEKAGYTFIGWSGTGITGTQMYVTVSSGSTGDKSYKAEFTKATYKIIYKGLTGASNPGNPATYTVDDQFILNNPTKAGYEFLGWKSTDSVNPEKTVEFKKGTTGNKEYTAQWKTTEYSITYDLAGGTLSGENPAKYTVETSDIVLVRPTKEGYSFLGWKQNGGQPELNARISRGSTGDKAFTAVWSARNYNISYSGIDGAIFERINTYTSDDSVNIPNPVKNGYTFLGWTGTDLNTETKDVVIPAGSTGDKSYKANWMLIDYSITINYNGGTSSTEATRSYTCESSEIVLPTPKKVGYIFAGWTGTGISGLPQKTVKIPVGSTGDRSYTAVWNERGDTHRVYFYGYKGYPIILDKDGNNYIEVKIGDPVSVDIDELNEAVGYKLTGWDIDFNSEYYRNLKDDIEVHAEWEVSPAEKYQIIINGSDSEVVCGQYEMYTATTDQYDSNGNPFSYWAVSEIDSSGNVKPGEVASYYRNYTFYVHCDVMLTAVYGNSANVRASTRISRVGEYTADYDWFTVYIERNIAPEYTLIQHGLIFTANESVGTNTNSFVIGTSGVYNGVSKVDGLTGLWTLSIRSPERYGNKIYLRSYIKVAGIDEPIYSDVQIYNN